MNNKTNVTYFRSVPVSSHYNLHNYSHQVQTADDKINNGCPHYSDGAGKIVLIHSSKT
jgi:hypothetical protein